MKAETIPNHIRPEINHIAIEQLHIAIAERKPAVLLVDNGLRPGASIAIAAKVLVQLAVEGEQ